MLWGVSICLTVLCISWVIVQNTQFVCKKTIHLNTEDELFQSGLMKSWCSTEVLENLAIIIIVLKVRWRAETNNYCQAVFTTFTSNSFYTARIPVLVPICLYTCIHELNAVSHTLNPCILLDAMSSHLCLDEMKNTAKGL